MTTKAFSTSQLVDTLTADTQGTLVISGTSPRITGDFSNATAANRVSVQTNTTNGNTLFQVIPNGSSTASSFYTWNSSDTTNASVTIYGTNAGEASFNTTKVGTGSYLPMTFYTGGSERMRLDNAGVLSVAPGSVSAPAYSFNPVGTYGSTGMFAPAANTIAFATTGGERMRIDSSGNVGIGVSPAGARLVVGQEGTDTVKARFYNSNATPTNDIFQSGVDAAAGTGYYHYRAYALIGSAPAPVLSIRGDGQLLVQGAGGLGYGTGSGGTVTQATSKSTAVTLNKTNGQITMNNAALAANTTVSFTFSNSTLATTDTIVWNIKDSSVSSVQSYNVWSTVGAGGCNVAIRNITAGSLSEAVVLNFAVIKASVS